jgi:hypothetical protein
MKKTSIIILSFFLILTGCTTILKLFYGLKDPEIENRESILEYCKKKGVNMENLATINSDDYYAKLANGIPEADIFNKRGEYIEYRQTDSSCNAGLFAFIPELHRDSVYRLTGKLNLNDEINKLRTLTGEQFVLRDTYDYDFYVIMYWARFIGRLNKDHINIWEQEASNNKNARIRVIKANVDIQEYYGDAGIEIYESMSKKFESTK